MLRQNVHNALNTIKCNMAGCGPTHEQSRYTTKKEHFASHTTSTLDNTAQPDLSLAFSIQMQRFRVLLGISRMSHRGASAGSSARFWNAEEEGIANAFLFRNSLRHPISFAYPRFTRRKCSGFRPLISCAVKKRTSEEEKPKWKRENGIERRSVGALCAMLERAHISC